MPSCLTKGALLPCLILWVIRSVPGVHKQICFPISFYVTVSPAFCFGSTCSSSAQITFYGYGSDIPHGYELARVSASHKAWCLMANCRESSVEIQLLRRYFAVSHLRSLLYWKKAHISQAQYIFSLHFFGCILVLCMVLWHLKLPSYHSSKQKLLARLFPKFLEIVLHENGATFPFFNFLKINPKRLFFFPLFSYCSLNLEKFLSIITTLIWLLQILIPH